MANEAGFPQTAQEVLTVILLAERSRKYVWTAGRVLIESGLSGRWRKLGSSEKKTVLKDIAKLLESLAAEGVLEIRPYRQGIGYGAEKGFNFVAAK